MKNKKHIENEIKKLRKIVNLTSATPEEKHTAWCCMLTLQWIYSQSNVITPTTIVMPRLGNQP